MYSIEEMFQGSGGHTSVTATREYPGSVVRTKRNMSSGRLDSVATVICGGKVKTPDLADQQVVSK